MISNFNPIPLPIPPMLCDYAQLGNNKSRYLAMYYACTHAAWSDGYSMATFNYFHVWEPFINHFLVRLHLLDADLGSDDTEPTSVLLLDRESNRIYLAPYFEGIRFCRENNQQPTPCELAEYLEHLGDRDISDLQKMGLHEFFGGYNAELAQWRANLIAWLDQQMTEESVSTLLDLYIQKSEQGDRGATLALSQFRDRLFQSIGVSLVQEAN